MEALSFSGGIALTIAPVFVLVFVLMAGTNYLVTPAAVKKHLGKDSGTKKWAIAIAGGIISTGPAFMWYPLLRDIRDKGAGSGFVAAFIYNRAIKIALLPLMIFYFGIVYTIVLTLVMIAASLLQGWLFEKAGI